MRIYLAGPINGCTDAEANDWRTEAKRRLVGHEYLDPMVRDYRGRESEPGIDKTIVRGDKQDIDSCAGMLVYFEKPSVGTSMEVLYAWERGIPVAIVNKSGKPLSPWLTYHSTSVSKTIKQAISKLNHARYPIRCVNRYTYRFDALCPTNRKTINYVLRIETDGETIMVEDIIRVIGKRPVFHEQLADNLLRRFGGHQTLTAHHHGVDIETERSHGKAHA